MDALGGVGCGGHGGWWWRRSPRRHGSFRSQGNSSRHSSSLEPAGSEGGYHFPFKQAATAASLALTGDTFAQLRLRCVTSNSSLGNDSSNRSNESCKGMAWTLFSNHDWLRALRMTSYGFLFYGPGSYAWYQYLDHCLPKQTVKNLLLKVLLNQIVLGPSVIAVVFAWNNLWQGKLLQLPEKYRKDALSTLFYGFKFWIPVSALNFWVVPLQARVAFMSMGSVFWNFCLSSTMNR